MASEMDHDGTRYTDNITDIAVLYNENDTSSIKVSTKLQEVISPLSATATMVTPQSTPAHIEQTEKNLPKMKGLVIIMTEELQSYAKDIWQRMYKAKRKTDENILTITYNFNGSMSKELTKHEVVDYSDENFSERIKAVLEDWLCNADDSGYGSSTVVIAYELFPLVEPLKSSKKGKVQDIKKIRDIIKTSLEIGDPLAASPNSELKEILSSEYKAEIDSVDMNPLCVKGKVVGERQFRRLKRDSDNKSLGKKFKEYAATKMGRDSIPFEIKIICNKVRESEEAPAVVNFSRSARESVISGVIFDIIKKKEYTPYDFYQTILKYRNDVNDIAAIRSDEDGYNMLHAIIVFNRLNLMLTLVHLKLFSKMIQDTVPLNSPSSFRGHTPRQIAESKRAKRFKDEVTNHERLINSMSRFLKACHDGNKDAALEKLNTQYQQIFERDSMRNNCLYWTIVSGNLDLFKALLDKGAEADNLNEQKENLLHVACMLGHSQFIPILMGRCSMDVTATCNNKRTPLERVAENGDVDSLKELLKANVLLTQCVLPFAASNGRLAFIRYALEDSSTRYMDVDMRDSTGRSALMKACENGKMEIVTYLHGQGAIVTVEDLRRRTALHVACENGHYDVTFWLIEKGADVNAQDCYTGAELCFLIRGKDKGRKAWHYVEVRRNVVHIFLKKTRAGQVDVAVYGTVVKSGWGEDPEKGVVDWVEKMFADRRNRTNAPKDITPLHMAIYKQHTRIARLLIEKGADVNRKDQFGMTPFMYAALRNEKEIAMLLEEKGANLNELDNEQKSALEIAEINEQTEMVNYIRGKTFMDPVKSFIGGPIKKIQQALHPDTLEKLRQDGKDTKMHLIDSRM